MPSASLWMPRARFGLVAVEERFCDLLRVVRVADPQFAPQQIVQRESRLRGRARTAATGGIVLRIWFGVEHVLSPVGLER
jgi:hypothetical protein